MKKKNILAATLLVPVLAMLPVSFEVVSHKASASVEISAFKKMEVIFYSEKDASKDLKKILESKSETEPDQKIRQYTKEQKIDFKVKTLTAGQKDFNDNSPKTVALAFPYKYVQQNADLQSYLKTEVTNGRKVFLYGDGLTFDDYKNVLGLDEMAIQRGALKGKFKFGEQKLEEAIKGPKKAEYQYAGESDVKQVIGFTNDSTNINQVYAATFNAQGMTTEMFMQSLLNQLVDTFDETYHVKKGSQPSVGFKSNVALADSEEVDAGLDSDAYAYSGSTQVGHINTDYFLQQDLSDGNSSYDYFTVIQYTQGWGSYYYETLWVDHDIPYDADSIKEWGPGDVYNQSTVEFAIPWGLTVTFSNNSDKDIDDIGNRDLDYGRWDVTQSGYVWYMEDGTEFKPSTAWLSRQSDSYAVMDIRTKAGFSASYTSGLLYAQDSIHVTYDY